MELDLLLREWVQLSEKLTATTNWLHSISGENHSATNLGRLVRMTRTAAQLEVRTLYDKPTPNLTLDQNVQRLADLKEEVNSFTFWARYVLD